VVSNKKNRKRIKAEGSEKIYEDNRWLVVRPFTLESSSLYGRHTQWCTVRDNNSLIDKMHSSLFYGYISSGVLYYIIDKLQYAREYRYAKICLYKDWNTKETWTDPTDTDLTTLEVTFFSGNLPTPILELIYDNWDSLRPHNTQNISLNPIAITKHYYSGDLSRYFAQTLIKYEKTPRLLLLLLTLNFLVASPALLSIFLFKKIQR